MNVVSIVILVFLAVCIFSGYRQGFVRVVFSLFSWVAVSCFIVWSVPYLNTFLQEKTPVYSFVEKEVSKQLQEKAEKKAAESTTETEEPVSILGIEIPGSAMDGVSQSIAQEGDKLLENSGAYDVIAASFAKWIIKGLAFVIALLIATLVLNIILSALDIVSHLPVLHGMNQALGAAAGGMKGILIIWALFYLLSIFHTTEWAQYLLAQIRQTPPLNYLYEQNLIAQLIKIFLL